MIKKNLVLKNRLGLHIRPCSMIVKTAGKYKADLKIGNKNMMVNAKSMLDLMQLGLTHGDEVEIVANGVDEEELISEIVKLFENKFGED